MRHTWSAVAVHRLSARFACIELDFLRGRKFIICYLQSVDIDRITRCIRQVLNGKKMFHALAVF